MESSGGKVCLTVGVMFLCELTAHEQCSDVF